MAEILVSVAGIPGAGNAVSRCSLCDWRVALILILVFVCHVLETVEF